MHSSCYRNCTWLMTFLRGEAGATENPIIFVSLCFTRLSVCRIGCITMKNKELLMQKVCEFTALSLCKNIMSTSFCLCVWFEFIIYYWRMSKFTVFINQYTKLPDDILLPAKIWISHPMDSIPWGHKRVGWSNDNMMNVISQDYIYTTHIHTI